MIVPFVNPGPGNTLNWYSVSINPALGCTLPHHLVDCLTKYKYDSQVQGKNKTCSLAIASVCVISCNKGQCNERLAQAVWARVIAKRRLAREVGSEEKKEEGQPAASTRLD